MRTLFTLPFVKWLLDRYNAAEGQVYQVQGHTYRDYDMEELIKQFRKEIPDAEPLEVN